VLASILAHPHLHEVSLACNVAASREHAGAAIAALLTVNAPALQRLNIAGCDFGDEGMGLVVNVLASNTHLRWLKLSDDDVSQDFRLNRLLPAAASHGVEVV
jgi:hypothetical protein